MKKLKKMTIERARKLIDMVKDNSGQGALDTAVVVLISIVLGALK